MGLVTMLKTKPGFEEYTIAQLQAMIHDLAIQEVRGSSKVCIFLLEVISHQGTDLVT